ncbi:MAG: hypothetical protein LBD37_10605 [Treponema sp.]|jgi:hypothetical protein|nr:hypothetical protein [Treponema sp.]
MMIYQGSKGGVILRERNVDKFSKNYKELDAEGKETLLRIGEKVYTMKNFVGREVSSLMTKKDNLKFENEGIGL